MKAIKMYIWCEKSLIYVLIFFQMGSAYRYPDLKHQLYFKNVKVDADFLGKGWGSHVQQVNGIRSFYVVRGPFKECWL